MQNCRAKKKLTSQFLHRYRVTVQRPDIQPWRQSMVEKIRERCTLTPPSEDAKKAQPSSA